MSNKSNNRNIVYLYDYIIRNMVFFFSNKDNIVTSRYVLYFDSENNIQRFENRLIEILSDADAIEDMRKRAGIQGLFVELLPEYEINNDDGKLEYAATQVRFTDGKYSKTIVYIPDCDRNGGVLGDAFKNNIRNKFVDEKEDKVLFYLSVKNIASVSKTTENFQKSGLPLCTEYVFEDLKDKISNVDGDNEKITLWFSLDKIMQNKPETDTSLIEFAPIMRIVEDKSLEREDFHDLHLFSMSMTDLGKGSKSLSDNYKLLRDINIAIEDQEVESCLSGYDESLASEIKRLYEEYAEEWDKYISYEEIVKRKKSGQKKFKVEEVAVKDADGTELSTEYYSKLDDNTILFFTKRYNKEKKFYIEIRCTQRAAVDSEKTDFDGIETNSRGTLIKVCVNKPTNFYNGTISIDGGKEKKKFNLDVIVMDTDSKFMPEAFAGTRKKKNELIFLFEVVDYTLVFGEEGANVELEIDGTNVSKIPYPIDSSNNTTVKFRQAADDEIVDECNLSFLVDDEFQLNSKIRFERQKLRILKIYELFNKCSIDKNTYSISDDVITNIYQKSDKFKIDAFTVAGNSYKTEQLFYIEREFVENRIRYAGTNCLSDISELSCNVPAEIIAAYDAICGYFSARGTCASLCPYDEELKKLYHDYIARIMEYIGKESKDFKHSDTLREEIHNILYLGMVVDTDGFMWLTPLSPLSVAYQIEMNEREEQIIRFDEELYSSLGYGSLLPFIFNADGKVFQTIKGNYPVQWACYYDAKQAIKGDKKTYYDKIKDYYTKFSYLFENIPNNMFILNIVGIYHTQEIIDALIELYRGACRETYRKNIDFRKLRVKINYYYQGLGRNEFDEMTKPDYMRKRVEKSFGKKDADLVDGFCDWYTENLSYFANRDEGTFGYSHITFCAMQADFQSNKTNAISRAKSGIMLGGLVSDIPSSLDRESGFYKYGFGAQHIEEALDDSLLCGLVTAYNELANCEMGSPIIRDYSIALAVQNTKSPKLKAIYDASNWVVFVEPRIDLDFFINQEDENDDLIIIHYPDKNITASGYSSITVTKKSQQYIDVITAYLKSRLTQYRKEMDIKGVIRNYNAYSGEWLMTFVKNNVLMIDEKISLVSAIRFCRVYFAHVMPEYTWVPLALDEILRVTGSIGGTLTNCLFSKNALVERGVIEKFNENSDDILMAGIKVTDSQISVKYIPIEVKHGQVNAEIKEKAHKQTGSTAILLYQTFVDKVDDEDIKRIDKVIYRNYMMQHVISNVEKMVAYGIVETDKEKYEKLINSSVRVMLLNDKYNLEMESNDEKYTFYFMEGRNNVNHQKCVSDNVTEIMTPLKGMFEYLIDDEILSEAVQSLVETEYLTDTFHYDMPDEEMLDYDDYDGSDEEIAKLESIVQFATAANSPVAEQDFEEEAFLARSADDMNGNPEYARVLIGRDIAGTPIYWEFGNKNLANRHLLITGTSGQGKTYSIQTMLYELAKVNMRAVIFDYTEGFNKKQLEKPFVDAMNQKIKERFFYYEGVPINPFIRHDIDLGGIIMKEKAADVASRLADIFSHVYDFGDQQSSAVFTAALNGINKHGDKMNMTYFRAELEELQDNNKVAKTVISKMEPFFQSISFENGSDFDWGEVLYGEESQISIFQLTGINREMQVIITELMLWDAWYYTKKFGNKDKPFVVVLDEAQNLSHKKSSPSAVILTEGRKFGWSAWFATQSLKILKDDEVTRLLQAAFKLYFKPTDDEIVKTARQLDPTGESNWTAEVKGLKKGQCIVVGERLKNNGTFGGNQPVVVSVSAFEERI